MRSIKIDLSKTTPGDSLSGPFILETGFARLFGNLLAAGSHDDWALLLQKSQDSENWEDIATIIGGDRGSTAASTSITEARYGRFRLNSAGDGAIAISGSVWLADALPTIEVS